MAGTPEHGHIFISYKRREPDRGFTHRLADDLRRAGHEVWMDVVGIEGAVDWPAEIQRALDASYAFVLVLSPDSVASDWVRNEMSYALRKMRGRVFPVVFREVEAPLELIRIQHIDFQGDYDAALARLLRDLPPAPRTGPRLPADIEMALRSQTGAVRWGAVAALIDFAHGDDAEQATLAREHLGAMAQNDPDERVRNAAQSFFDEEAALREAEAERARLEAAEQARQEALQRAQQAREITPPPVKPRPPAIEDAVPEAIPSRRGIKPLVWIGGAAALVLVFGLLALAGVFGGGAAPAEEEEPAPTQDIVGEEVAATEEAAPTLAPAEEECESGYSADCPVTANDQWTPVTQDFGGVEMALVPTGCFMMGSSEDQIDLALQLCASCGRVWFEDEIPQHEQCFDAPFWIDVYEVTNAQYGSEGSFSGADLPRETVGWFEAVAHCESRGARLPTEAEWEYAARGPDGLVYPWGNSFDGSLADFCDANCTYDWRQADNDDGYVATAPVGNYPGGASWVGAMDMSGNVEEWVSSIGREYPYDAADGREVDGSIDSSSKRVLRGGSWNNSATFLRAACRPWDGPGSASYGRGSGVGVRCARDYSP